ncbi:MAG: DUF4157 domain-containing protein [Proteobacteria bacterium]|nr:DUF4157 domain-containing protein [Pseudomonadota bacterium]
MSNKNAHNFSPVSREARVAGDERSESARLVEGSRPLRAPGVAGLPSAAPAGTPPAQRVAAPGHSVATVLMGQARPAPAAAPVAGTGGGKALPEEVRGKMEGALGMDFSAVRVHEGLQATAMGALAYTRGTDIHFAPGQYRPYSQRGQELLGHELAHVRQQAEGRVRATTQMKGMGLNDDVALEREADMAGREAARPDRFAQGVERNEHTNRSVAIDAKPRDLAPAPTMPSQTPIQAKLTFKKNGSEIEEELDAVVQALRTFATTQRRRGLPTDDGELRQRLETLQASNIDYGVTFIDNEQHLMALYYYAMQEPPSEDEDDEWQSLVKPSEKTYRTAFLGAGASIAYYINSMGSNYDPKEFIIIGPEQPWRNERGPGVVAHPEHMITPMREHVGEDAIDNRWMERGKFSNLIDTALDDSKIERVPDEVTAIARDGDFYVITVKGMGEPIYARNIVSGMGVGGHRRPPDVDAEAIAGDADGVGAERRIMDMDLFTQVASRLTKDGNNVRVGDDESSDKSQITMILAGGNGAIDVAFDALNKGYKVHWIVGSGPKFLPGFFNYAAYLPYLRTLQDTRQLDRVDLDGRGPEQEIARVQNLLPDLYDNQEDMFEGVIERFQHRDTKFEGVYFGRLGQVEPGTDNVTAQVTVATGQDDYGDIQGDILVYGLGQDYKTFELFKDFADDLVPELDVNQRFNNEGAATLGLKSSDGRLKIIGATAFRLAGLKEIGDMGPESPVITSLPDNVLINDQLTPTRSQIEATNEFVPSNVHQRVNFVTDDRTVLAIHIAAHYPALADTVTAWGRWAYWTGWKRENFENLVQRIINSRTEKVDGGPNFRAVPPHQQEFQEFWERKLSQLNGNLINRALAQMARWWWNFRRMMS